MTTKITFQSGLILDAVSKAALWVSKKSPIIALQCIRFRLDNEVIILEAMDGGSTDISIYLDASGIGGEFDVCIPPDRLLPKLRIITKSSPTVSISFGKIITVSSGKHTSRINSVSPELFPTIDRTNTGDVQATSVDEFVTAVKMTTASADPKSPFPVFEGVYLNGNDVVSADGARLVIYETSSIVNEPSLVPAIHLSRIANILDGLDEVAVYKHKEKIIVSWDGGIVSASLISAKFPDYKSVMPTEFETEFAVNRAELHDAVLLAKTDALDSENLIVISASDELGFRLSAASSSGEHHSDLDINHFKGQPKQFGISVKYLSDAISKLKGANITFGVNDPTGIIVLSDSDNYRYGIMPMYVGE